MTCFLKKKGTTRTRKKSTVLFVNGKQPYTAILIQRKLDPTERCRTLSTSHTTVQLITRTSKLRYETMIFIHYEIRDTWVSYITRSSSPTQVCSKDLLRHPLTQKLTVALCGKSEMTLTNIRQYATTKHPTHYLGPTTDGVQRDKEPNRRAPGINGRQTN